MIDAVNNDLWTEEEASAPDVGFFFFLRFTEIPKLFFDSALWSVMHKQPGQWRQSQQHI